MIGVGVCLSMGATVCGAGCGISGLTLAAAAGGTSAGGGFVGGLVGNWLAKHVFKY